MDDDMKTFDILLIGTSSVGKKSLICRFLGEDLDENSRTSNNGPTTPAIMPYNKKITVKIYKTLPEDCDNYLKKETGIMLIYQIDYKSSFEEIKNLYTRKLKKLKNEVCYLIGNKSDLEGQRNVTKTEAEEFASSNDIKFYEVSAKKNENVSNAFDNFTKDLLNKNKDTSSNDNSNSFNQCLKCILI